MRLQVDGMGGKARRYNGIVDCFLKIFREEGVRGMWKGAGPTIGRATVLAATEMSAYDEIKKRLLQVHTSSTAY